VDQGADLSIVVVHWNVAHLLDACLRSLERERGASTLRIEVLVVDCDSPDRAYRDIVAQFPGITLIELPTNRGYAAGCNAGIRRSRGDAVLLLNPDTEVHAGALSTLWQTLHIASHVGMVAPLLLNPDGSVQSAGYRFPGSANLLLDFFPFHPRLVASPLNGRVPAGDGTQPIQIDYPLGAAMCVRRSALDSVGLLDEGYGMYSEEIDWCYRFAQHDWTILLAPAARVTHFGGQSTAQRAPQMHEALWMSRARYIERWGTSRQRRVARAIVSLGTRWDDRRADASRRDLNRRIRNRFQHLTKADES
jgi:GT2 family glycosyltransferase